MWFDKVIIASLCKNKLYWCSVCDPRNLKKHSTWMWGIVLLGHILSTTGDALNIIPAESCHEELDEQITTNLGEQTQFKRNTGLRLLQSWSNHLEICPYKAIILKSRYPYLKVCAKEVNQVYNFPFTLGVIDSSVKSLGHHTSHLRLKLTYHEFDV